MQRTALLLVLLLAGCAADPEPVSPALPPAPPSGPNYDPARCGTIVGKVCWHFQPPTLPPIYAPRKPADITDESPLQAWPNPNAPEVNRVASSVRAVVYLRQIDATCAKPWDFPPVRIEIADATLSILQGEQRSRFGIVRPGATVEFVSREPDLQIIRARGAAHFGQPLTQPGVVRTRTLLSPGVVELSSGAGYFWHRSHLFVAEHPYYTVSDAQGNYRLENVPTGSYDIVAWLPNWRESDIDRNGDTGYRTATEYAEPLTRTKAVRVLPGLTTTAHHLTFTAK